MQFGYLQIDAMYCYRFWLSETLIECVCVDELLFHRIDCPMPNCITHAGVNMLRLGHPYDVRVNRSDKGFPLIGRHEDPFGWLTLF
jgi:hypothetical protein